MIRDCIAIDPGTRESGVVIIQAGLITDAKVLSNEAVVGGLLSVFMPTHPLLIEKIEGMGMAVGKEVFTTVWWTGRFHQAFDGKVEYITRREVKLHLCGTSRAKDANVLQALKDRLGAPGTKKNPGWTYGVKSHCWPALAVALTWSDRAK